jgi:hypothetical protein
VVVVVHVIASLTATALRWAAAKASSRCCSHCVAMRAPSSTLGRAPVISPRSIASRCIPWHTVAHGASHGVWHSVWHGAWHIAWYITWAWYMDMDMVHYMVHDIAFA